MARFEKNYEMSDFDKWLIEVPWRLERYYGIVPGYEEEDKQELLSRYPLEASRKPTGEFNGV